MYVLLQVHIACLCLSISIHPSIYPSVCVCVWSCFSCVWLFVTLWTMACQAPLSMGFSRQEYWSGCHAFPQGISPIQGLNSSLLGLLHWQVGSLLLAPPGKPICLSIIHLFIYLIYLLLSLNLPPSLPPSFAFFFPSFLHFLCSLFLPPPSSHPSFHSPNPHFTL